MLSKEQMEEMWRTGPIGVLKSHCTANKGKKLFKVKVTPYVTTDIAEHVKTYEIWSKTQNDATWDAKTAWYKEHTDVNQTGIRVSIVS